MVLRKLAALLLTVLTLTGCLDEAPSEQAIANLLEVSANQELAVVRAGHGAGPNAGLIPDAVRIINLKKLAPSPTARGSTSPRSSST